MTPRRFLWGVACWCVLTTSASGQTRPNILWLSSEDNGPQIGAYGDDVSTTPTLDALAARGVRFTRVWSPAPVCAPARTAIITGVLQQTTGGMHMRSDVPLGEPVRMFPALLREAGYHTTNNVKTDYNHPVAPDVWDESSPRAHWRSRRPGQPFFAVFNSTTTHESQIRKRPHALVHDPAAIAVPPYHPDTPEVRQDRAQYYDKVTEMDAEFGARLRELDADGLADSTIVVYWGDHGVGLPRGKRWLYPAGLEVPLIVYVPERFRGLEAAGSTPGSASDRLVSLLDLAPSMLSLAGIRPPAWMQGQAFLGPFASAPREWLHAGRDRMDERVDVSRAIRDARFQYIRNYRPDRAQGEYLAYMFETPTTQVWRRRFEANQLDAVQRQFWVEKAPEELYDLSGDPHAVRNLVDDPALAPVLQRFRAVLRAHLVDTGDLGLLPEVDLHRRRGTRPPLALSHDRAIYPVERIVDAAERASRTATVGASRVARDLRDEDPAVRYWAAMGLGLRGASAVGQAKAALVAMLADAEPAPRIAAADALARFEVGPVRAQALATLLAEADHRRTGRHAAMLALDTILALGATADPIRAAAAAVPPVGDEAPAREREYVGRLTTALSAIR